MDRLYELTDAEGNSTQTLYYPDGKVWKIIDAMGNEPATYTYTTSGSVDTITDAENNITEYQYDGYGRPQYTLYADHTEGDPDFEEIEYDIYSRVDTTTNRSDQTIEIDYDALGRVESKTVDSTDTINYFYDSFGRQSDVKYNSDNDIIHYDYDHLGRLDTVTYPGSEEVSYTYDIAGNRNTLTYPDSTSIEYEYDELNRLTDIFDSTDLENPIVTYGYDALSRRITADYENGKQTTYTYGNAADETAGRLIGLTTAGIIYDYDNAGHDNYDAVGNLLNFTAAGDPHTYTYDNIYQLKTVDYPDTFNDTTFNYDAVGNRDTINDGSETNYIANNLNQYDQVGPTDSETSYFYDTRGNLTYDGSGNYIYDAENRLIEATDQSATYTYDPFGRRISKNVDGSVITYLYDGDQVICEYNSGGDIARKFVYGTGIDEPVRMTAVLSADLSNDGDVDIDDLVVLGQSWMLSNSDSGFCRLGNFKEDGGPEVINNSDIDTLADYFGVSCDFTGNCNTGLERNIYYHFNQLGSVIALTDESGSVIETYKYDVFGRPYILDRNGNQVTVSTIGNPYMFTARRYDPETTLYYYRARMYNPYIGRFMQTDPIGYGDGMGWYAYCGNNPIIFVDPLGLRELSFGAALGLGFDVTLGNNGEQKYIKVNIGVGVGAWGSYDHSNAPTVTEGLGTQGKVMLEAEALKFLAVGGSVEGGSRGSKDAYFAGSVGGSTALVTGKLGGDTTNGSYSGVEFGLGSKFGLKTGGFLGTGLNYYGKGALETFNDGMAGSMETIRQQDEQNQQYMQDCYLNIGISNSSVGYSYSLK